MQAEFSVVGVVVELFGRKVVCIKAIIDVGDVGDRPIEHEQN